MVACKVVEGPGVLRMVVANLRADQQGIEWLRQTRRLEVDPERDLFVGRLAEAPIAAAVEGGVGETSRGIGKVEIVRHRGGIEALVVAPHLASPLQRETSRDELCAIP